MVNYQVIGILLLVSSAILGIITLISVASIISWWIWALFILTIILLIMGGIFLFLDINKLQSKLSRAKSSSKSSSQNSSQNAVATKPRHNDDDKVKVEQNS